MNCICGRARPFNGDSYSWPGEERRFWCCCYAHWLASWFMRCREQER